MPAVVVPEEDKPWCVLVAGSRDLTYGHLPLVVSKLAPFVMRGSVLIHGAGPAREGKGIQVVGCDYLAELAGRSLKMRIFGSPALWHVYDKPAGPIRNRLCAALLGSHAIGGYRLAALFFPTGGPGTQSALDEVKNIRAEVKIEVHDTFLEEPTK